MRMLLPPLQRPMPDGGASFVPTAVGQGPTRAASPLPGQMLPPTAAELPVPGGITQKVASSLAFAKLIDFSVQCVANQSTLFLQSTDANRNFLALRNGSATANLYFGFNTDASTLSTFRIPPGGLILLDTVVPQDDVYYFADAAGGVLCCAYSTIKPDWKY